MDTPAGEVVVPLMGHHDRPLAVLALEVGVELWSIDGDRIGDAIDASDGERRIAQADVLGVARHVHGRAVQDPSEHGEERQAGQNGHHRSCER